MTLLPGQGSDSGSGFVDFYEMLGAPRTASTIQLRSRINEMYGEAQANRDHRNLDKRAQYTALLHWLPVCRSVLLHEGKRGRYDAYAAQAAQGQPPTPFKSFLSELTESGDDAPAPTSAHLTIRTNRAAPAEPPKAHSSIATAAPDGPAQTQAATPETPPPATEATPVAPVLQSASGGWVTLQNPELRREMMGLTASAGGGLVALAALFVLSAAAHLSAVPAAAGCVVVGIVVWAILRAILVGKAPAESQTI